MPSQTGGQQQRLCIARALAVSPDVLLTIVTVTHNMQQAARVSEYTGFFLKSPSQKETDDYINGCFG